MQEKFSVSMCVYGKDNPNHFKIAVDSIINQTVKPSEIILVVDGPISEKLNKIITNYKKLDFFHVIYLKTNQGHGKARRIGLKHCSNELVALMDADDISVPDRFEQQLKVFLHNPNVSVCGGDIAEFIDYEDNIVGKRIVPKKDKEIKEYLKKRCPMNQVTVMFKKSDVIKAGGYLDWLCNEDYYLWIRMALKKFIFVNTGTVLVNVRVGKDMYKRRGGLKYFKSEVKLQIFMMKHKIIPITTFILNVLKRLILQVLLPCEIRGLIFRKFARES